MTDNPNHAALDLAHGYLLQALTACAEQEQALLIETLVRLADIEILRAMGPS